MRLKRSSAVNVLAGVFFAGCGLAQTTPQNATPASMSPHQAQLVSDAQKLHKLSVELKSEIAKTPGDQLSINVIRKAQEVEKLAKSLKEEMSKNR